MRQAFKRFLVSFTLVSVLLAIVPAVLFAAPGDVTFVNSSGLLDFGSVQVGERVLATAQFRNNTNQFYKIEVPSVPGVFSHAFTSPANQGTLSPNSIANVVFAVEPTAAGRFNEAISVRFRPSVGAIEVVSFGATVLGTGSTVPTGSLEVSPSSLSFGDVQVGTSNNKTVVFTNSSATAVTLQVVVLGNAFEIDLRSFTVPAQSKIVREVKFAPESQNSFAGSLQVSQRLNNGSTVLLTNVSLLGAGVLQNVGVISASPASISFGTNVAIGSTVTRTVTVTNTTNSSVVLAVDVTGSTRFTVPTSISVPRNSSRTFTVGFVPNNSVSQSGTLRLRRNGVTIDTVALSGRGVSVETGSVSVDNSSVDFGSVDVGDVESRSLTVRNTTNQSKVVGFETSGSNQFSLPASTTIPANSTRTVQVTYQPTFVGLVSGQVVARVDGVTVDTVAVSGRGVSATTGSFIVSPTSVNFGEVELFDVETREVRFTNNYNSTVRVTSDDCFGTTSSNGLSCESGARSFDVPANSYRDVTIQFRPTTERSFTESFDFRTSSVDNSRSYTVVATGEGEDENTTGGSANFLSDFEAEVGTSFSSGYYQQDYIDIEFRLADDADLTLTVYDRNNRVINRVFTDRFFRESSSIQSARFSLPAGTADDAYRVVLEGETTDSSRRTDSETDYVSGTGGGNNGSTRESLIQNFSGRLFDRGSDDFAAVRFTLERDSYLTLRLYDDNGSLLDTVFSRRYFRAGANNAYEFDLDRNLSTSRDYRLRLEAETVSSPDYEDVDQITVDFDGYTGGGDTPGVTGCRSFADVNPASRFCQAVDYVVQEDIITGDYRGGVPVIRASDTLTRAEAVAIIVRAVEAPLVSNYQLPFYDVQNNAWYAPYLRTAVQIGAIQGYPDGTFRPGAKMTRAEFYKAFLRAVQNSGKGRYFFNSDINYKPFGDTTLTANNVWYLPYADWARRYFDGSDFARRQFNTSNLNGATVPTGSFRPGKEITRGHIIELIHEMHLRNLAQF